MHKPSQIQAYKSVKFFTPVKFFYTLGAAGLEISVRNYIFQRKVGGYDYAGFQRKIDASCRAR